jgi:nitrite reductase/ring-hydroxylating ferredoxin subunit
MNSWHFNKHSFKYLFALIALSSYVVSSCKKDNTNDVAQNYVDFYLYLNEPSNIALNAVGGWLYVNQGTKGIIVYRRALNEFTALERNCTYDPTASCATVQVVSGITAIDSCCTSRFSIYDGSIINGPATQPLYQYSTTFDGNALRVYN